MVLYGSIAGVSIGSLFLGGIVPGILMAIGLMAVVFLLARKRQYPRDERLPTAGEVRVDGLATTAWDPIRLRRRTGWVIQETGLFPHFTVARNVGLVPALEWLVQNMRHRTGLACELTIDDPAITLPSAQSTAVFRIVQEALTNVAKHARASRAEVALRRIGGSLEVTVRDDGVGFAVQEPRKPESFGLLGLRERISLLRGTASIDSAPGAGTTIVVTIPLAAEAT